MSYFDAEKYWSTHSKKSWVVVLKITRRVKHKKYTETVTKYVWAKTSGGAIKTAIHHTQQKGRISCTVRLANPADLGCC